MNKKNTRTWSFGNKIKMFPNWIPFKTKIDFKSTAHTSKDETSIFWLVANWGVKTSRSYYPRPFPRSLRGSWWPNACFVLVLFVLSGRMKKGLALNLLSACKLATVSHRGHVELTTRLKSSSFTIVLFWQMCNG